MSNTASLKKEYAERIAPALKSQFHPVFFFYADPCAQEDCYQSRFGYGCG